MIAIFKKELKTYFASMTGYIFIGILLLLAGIMCLSINLFNGPTNYELSLSMVSYIFLLIVPILTMSVVADERKNKTDQLLYSLPVNASGIVVGKFGALVAVFAVPVLVMCLFPFVLSLYGQVNFLSAYTGIFGFFLLGCALLSFGLLISSLTESPVIAAVISFFFTAVYVLAQLFCLADSRRRLFLLSVLCGACGGRVGAGLFAYQPHLVFAGAAGGGLRRTDSPVLCESGGF